MLPEPWMCEAIKMIELIMYEDETMIIDGMTWIQKLFNSLGIITGNIVFKT